MTDIITAEFSGINHKGAAAGSGGGKKITAFGVLPGEKAEVYPVRRRRQALHCRVHKILAPSPERTAPREEHYLSCSPWQVFAYDCQVKLKSILLRDIFRDVCGEQAECAGFFPSPSCWGYRTKMEFSFIMEKGRLKLALNQRGDAYRKVPLAGGCALAGAKLNEAALFLVDAFNSLNLTGGVLKTLTVRESKSTGKIIALLTVKDKNFNAAKLHGTVSSACGFITAYSEPQSPSSVITEILLSSGDDFLEEEISGKKFTYGCGAFFQNNIPQLEKALEIIDGAVPRSKKMLELFSGAGVIGISLAQKADEITGVEISEEGTRHARENARRNDVSNYRALNLPAEKSGPDILQSADVLILDPPRSGMAPKLTKKIAEAGPERIVYLSCNPLTQAGDYSLLKDRYRITGLYGFDFHPHTPHIESLLLLKRR